MAVGYTRQSSGLIVSAGTILASHFNNEYNALENAFHATTGHDHDGTTGGGAPIKLASSVSGTLPIANGGTGAITDAAARTALGLVIGTDVQAQNASLSEIAALATTDSNFIVGNGTAWVAETGTTVRASLGLGSLATLSSVDNSNWSGTDLAVANGGTGASDATTARSNLGLVIGTNVQAENANLTAIAALATTDSNFIVGNGATWVAESGATVRTSLGLGSLATLSSVNDGNWSGTDLAVLNGGTGASDAGTARTNLGLAIGTNVQAQSARLDEIAALAVTDSNVIVGNGSSWVAESGATARTSLGAIAATDVHGQQTIAVPKGAMVPTTTNGAASGSVETTTNKIMLESYDFDASTEEYIQFAVQMPKNWNESTVICQAVWSHPTTATNFGVVWGFSAVAFSNDDAADAALGTEVTVTDTGGTTDDIYHSPESTGVTIAGTPAAEDWVVFQVARVAANGSDTMAVDARLHSVKIHYTTDALNDS